MRITDAITVRRWWLLRVRTVALDLVRVDPDLEDGQAVMIANHVVTAREPERRRLYDQASAVLRRWRRFDPTIRTSTVPRPLSGARERPHR